MSLEDNKPLSENVYCAITYPNTSMKLKIIPKRKIVFLDYDGTLDNSLIVEVINNICKIYDDVAFVFSSSDRNVKSYDEVINNFYEIGIDGINEDNFIGGTGMYISKMYNTEFGINQLKKLINLGVNCLEINADVADYRRYVEILSSCDEINKINKEVGLDEVKWIAFDDELDNFPANTENLITPNDVQINGKEEILRHIENIFNDEMKIENETQEVIE